MKAVRIHAYGGPEALVYADAPRPEIADDQVLIKMYATSVNPVDRFTRAGYLQGMVDFPLPLTLGLDLSGVVEAIGKDVTTLAVGDAVYGYSNMMRQGTYAEYAVVSATEVAPKPNTIDHRALPLRSRWRGWRPGRRSKLPACGRPDHSDPWRWRRGRPARPF